MTRRLGFAALAGVLVAVVYVALAYAGIELVSRGPCRSENFECLGQSIMAEIAAMPLACLAGWPLLYWLGVRPALRVAVLGPVVFGGLCWAMLSAVPDYAVAAFGLAPVSYLVAAWLTARETGSRARIVLVMAVVAAYVGAAMLTFWPNR
ncbi:MAG TPA: hypothetical protein VFC19_17970 [Candidatus Limnocylindrales bacterium]|nr:hypothetical protein [Candidatus Limnocylindrales bacterium]